MTEVASTLIGEGASSLTFTFGLKNFDLAECEDFGQCGFTDTILARLFIDEVRDTSEGFIGHESYRLFIEGVLVDSADSITDNYEFSYNLADYVGLGAGSLDIFAELFVGSLSGEDTDGFPPLPFASVARMAADQSAFLRIDNVTSANGSSYLGRPSPVPLPAPLALLALGLVRLFRVRRHVSCEA